MPRKTTLQKIADIESKKFNLDLKIAEIRSLCPHKNLAYKNHGSSGHWDQDDSYWRDLQSILTLASLARFDGDKEMKKRHADMRKDAKENKYGLGKVILSNIQDDLTYTRRMRNILELLKNEMMPNNNEYNYKGYREIPVIKLTKFQKKERIKNSKESWKAERTINQIMDDITRELEQQGIDLLDIHAETITS